MKTKLLSFLGTSDYKMVNYEIDGIIYSTPFIQEALIRKIIDKKDSAVELILFCTDQAEKRNFMKLKECLQEYNNDFSLSIQRIPLGKNEDEIWEIFDNMVERIEDHDDIYLDITHGFRSLPMMATAIVDYAKEIYEINLIDVFYGAFEAKDEYDQAPVFRLRQFYELQRWTAATDKFLTGGQLDIVDLITRELRKLKKKYKGQDPLLRVLEQLGKNVDLFMRSIKTNRSQDTTKYALILKTCFKKIETLESENDYKGLRPFLRILGKIEKMVSDFKEDGLIWNTHCMVKLCYSFGMYQQVFTLLGENGTNCLMALSKVESSDYHDREMRERVRKDYFAMFKEKTMTELTMNIDKKYFHQRYVNFIQNDYRNDVNHGGFDRKAYDAKSIIRNAEKLINDFEVFFGDLMEKPSEKPLE